MYLREELLDIFLKVVKTDKSHRDYLHTIEEARWCFGTMTGKRDYTAVVSYRLNETDDEKKQRLRVFNSRTPEVAYGVEKMFNEVHRSDDVVDEIRYENNTTAEKAIKDGLERFHGEQTLQEYLEENLRHHTFHDPNGWLLLSFDLAKDGSQEFWPMEVPAHEAFNFEKKHGIVQYFVLRRGIEYKRTAATTTYIQEKDIMPKPANHQDPPPAPYYPPGTGPQHPEAGPHHAPYLPDPQPTDKRIGFKYVLFAAGVTFEARHVPPDCIAPLPAGFKEQTIQITRNGQLSNATFQWRETLNELKDCPAYPWGYKKDPETAKRTYVSALYPAKTVIQDLEIRKAEYDLAHACHGFLKEFLYVPPCSTCKGSGKVRGDMTRDTQGGREFNQIDCPKCKGKGELEHTTTQDKIRIKLPPDVKEIIPLANLIHYAELPEHLFRLQKEDWTEAKADVLAAIFVKQIFDRQDVTATENRLNWRSVYNALQPYAKQYSILYVWAAKMWAQIHGHDPDGKLIVMHAFSNDFKMETVQELLSERKTAKEVGAPMEVLRHIDQSLIAQQHKGDPEFLKRQIAVEQFKPFRGKSEMETTLVLGQLAKSHPMYIKWLYFEDIIQEIFDTTKGWHLMEYKKQKVIFDTVAAKFIEEETTRVEDQQFTAFANALTNNNDPQRTGTGSEEEGTAEEGTEGSPGAVPANGRE